MKYIELTRNKRAIVSNEDFAKLSEHKWCTRESGGIFYAVRNSKKIDKRGKRGMIHMHKEILKPKLGTIDHIDGDGLNNQRSNLRIATLSQNQYNRKININNKSGFKGISYFERDKKWRAVISANKKYIHIGLFTSKVAAHKAYKEASIKYHGDFRKIK